MLTAADITELNARPFTPRAKDKAKAKGSIEYAFNFIRKVKPVAEVFWKPEDPTENYTPGTRRLRGRGQLLTPPTAPQP